MKPFPSEREQRLAECIFGVMVKRFTGKPILPEPSDIPSEADLLGAVILGYEGAAAEAKSLSPRDFVDPFWQAVWLAMEALEWERISVPMVAKVVAAAELSSEEDVAEALRQCAEGSPLVPRQSARRVREAARARRLVGWLRALEEDICLGRVDADKALERMRKATERK